MEEFIVRIGASAAGLKNELGRAGAWAKAWATTLVEDLHGKLGRMFAAGFLLDKGMEFGARVFERIRERVLAIKRAQGELPGVSTNFIQGVFNYLDRVGLSFETASKPLLKFKQMLDAAKMNPGGQEMRTLERYNIIASEADLKTQKYTTSVAKLSEAYLKSGKNLKVLEDLMGKESLSPAMLALLELGPAKIEKMGRGNIFTTLTPSNLAFYKRNFQGATSLGQVIEATLGNMIGNALNHDIFTMFARGVSKWRHPIEALRHPIKTAHDIWNGEESKEAEAEAKVEEDIRNKQQLVALQNKLLELKEKDRLINADIADQGKASVDEMAGAVRSFTGAHAPRLYGMSPRMLIANNIKTLEERAKVAFMQGDDPMHDQLMAQAQSIRASNPWLMDKDRDPMKHANAELTIIKNELKSVQEMADDVNKANKHSKASE